METMTEVDIVSHKSPTYSIISAQDFDQSMLIIGTVECVAIVIQLKIIYVPMYIIIVMWCNVFFFKE